ncbi:MAG: hypothetical protein FWE08_09055 [Oscillospiraceae bacterium]|nr:hypothetical protein [Oscillospiraceae bacterium]
MLLIIQGAVTLGLLWAFLALAVHLSFRVLEMPDLSVEGTVILGAGTAASVIYAGFNPFLATFLAMCVGAVGGLVTGILHTKFRIPPILAGILTMIASWSIVLRIMGGSPLVAFLRAPTVYTFLENMGLSNRNAVIVFGILALAVFGTLLYCFYGTEIGAALRATGNNRQMAKAQGVNTDRMVILGLMVSNGFVGLAGALVAQMQRSASVDMGVGTIIFGLASVIIAEVIFPVRRFWVRMITLVAGSVIYRIIIAIVLRLGMDPSDMRLFIAITVALALMLPVIREFLSRKGKWDKNWVVWGLILNFIIVLPVVLPTVLSAVYRPQLFWLPQTHTFIQIVGIAIPVLLLLSSVLLLVSLILHKSKMRVAFALWGFGLSAFVSIIYIFGIRSGSGIVDGLDMVMLVLHHIFYTVLPFATLALSVVAMIFLVKYRLMTARSEGRVS